jgi:hypothetical protein
MVTRGNIASGAAGSSVLEISSGSSNGEERRGSGMNFEPVKTKADLDSLDQADVLEGYMSAERGDPEPGPNRGRAFWHGWRNRMIDLGQIPSDDASRQLVKEVVEAMRAEAAKRDLTQTEATR